jgi:hypothetical protein
MVKWQAIGPLSILLQYENLFHENISVCKYESDEVEKLIGKDQDYWSKVNFSLRYKNGYWLKLDLDVESNERAWEKAVAQVRLFLEALALFKSTLSLLAVGGLYVKRIGEGDGPTGHFGWDNTIIGRKYYPLKKTEYDDFVDLLTKYKRFWHDNKVTDQARKQLRRINIARYYFLKNFQTIDLVERYIFLSVALEALYGEGQNELRYRYSNRAALLLGDDVERRKAVFNDVQKAYKKRSKILHGGTGWIIEPKEVSGYNEIIRQSILRCISLYTQGYLNMGKTLDECMHDPEKHVELLKDAKALFGSLSGYRELQESPSIRSWAIRN